MNMLLSILVFVIGLSLVVYFAEKLVKGAVHERKKIPRWAGAVLVVLYVIFFAGGYFV